ncbi:MAG: undecaprenyldiphospho-muramoylpentapeptide beta-N-acetylglucosaminyltransferase [Gammaproteobacteria bacterium]|nr:undecaprenyldiphospho-muramoylpentapeptide beta-N-acetylglucosaminyltransferase [Gammaproteobacteria bacterium]
MNGPVMIVAGGTGGHVYPGIAVAEVLRAQGCELCWMGTQRGVEARVVPAAGLELLTIPVSGLRRSGLLRWLAAPFMLATAVACAVKHMLRVRPALVLGMGGFVSGPGGFAAWLCRRPLVIHEQNAIAGLTNRLLARFARRVLEAFPATFPAAVHAIETGNPVRAAISDIAAARRRDGAGLQVLVFGGSRGARALNEQVPRALAACNVSGLRVRHQCGAADAAATRARYAELGLADVVVEDYIDDMVSAYAAADLVIARAGATSIAEIAAAGVAAVLVPYPYAVDDHQTANARFLADHAAAVLAPEPTIATPAFTELLAGLLRDPARRAALGANALARARPQAAVAVARQCLEVADAG